MEKHLLPLFAVLSGVSKPGTFSKGYRFVPATNEENLAKGTLLLNLSLGSTEQIDLELLGTQLVNSFQETFYQEPELAVPVSLKNAFAQIPLKLKEVLPSLGAHSLQLQITAAVIWGQFLYLGRYDAGEVIIVRDNYVGPINFNKIASGRLQDGDWLFLANSNFWTNLSTEKLKSLTVGTNFEEILKKIDLVVGDKEDVSCVLAYFKVEEDLENSEKLTLLDPTPAVEKFAVGIYLQRLGSVIKVSLIRLWYFLKKGVVWLKPKIVRLSGQAFKRRQPGEHHEPARGVKKRNKWRLLIPLLIVIFTLGLLGNLYFKGKQDKVKEATALLQAAVVKKDEAVNLQILNSQKARDLLSEAQQSLEEVKKLNPKEKGVESLEKEIGDLLATLKREFRFAQLPLFYDLKPLQANLDVSSISFGKEGIVTLDKSNGSLLLLDLKEKKGSILVTDGRLKGGRKLVVDGNTAYVSVASNLVRFNLDSKTFSSDLSTGGQINDFSIYSGSIYLLIDNTLKKAVLSGDSLSLSNYVSAGGVDLSGARGVSVDGFVWVANSGSILKLSRGEREDFSLSGLERGLKNPDAIYSAEGTKYLYLLDKENGRVVVFEKTGSYYAQYITPQIDEITSLIADENKNRLYLAGKEKIYLVEIVKGN